MSEICRGTFLQLYYSTITKTEIHACVIIIHCFDLKEQFHDHGLALAVVTFTIFLHSRHQSLGSTQGSGKLYAGEHTP